MAHKKKPFVQGLGGLGPNYVDSPRECRPEILLPTLPYAPVRLLRAWPSPSLHPVEAEFLNAWYKTVFLAHCLLYGIFAPTHFICPT